MLRGLAKRLVLLLLALAALMLAGTTAGAGIAAGALLALALIVHATTFGVAVALRAAPPRALRIVGLVGLALAGAAGVWMARDNAFEFIVLPAGALPVSVGGAIMHGAAALVVSGALTFVFLAVAGRATALGDGP